MAENYKILVEVKQSGKESFPSSKSLDTNRKLNIVKGTQEGLYATKVREMSCLSCSLLHIYLGMQTCIHMHISLSEGKNRTVEEG